MCAQLFTHAWATGDGPRPRPAQATASEHRASSRTGLWGALLFLSSPAFLGTPPPRPSGSHREGLTPTPPGKLASIAVGGSCVLRPGEGGGRGHSCPGSPASDAMCSGQCHDTHVWTGIRGNHRGFQRRVRSSGESWTPDPAAVPLRV